VAQAAARTQDPNPELARVLNEAHWHLLRAETSCNFYWGEAWIYKSHVDLDSVAWHLGEARAILGDRLFAVAAPETAASPDQAATAAPPVEAAAPSEAAPPVAEPETVSPAANDSGER
jgi:hypothetical protein